MDWSSEATNSELILSMGVEGGGAKVYRIMCEDGVTRYAITGSSMAAEDDEEWKTWKSKLFATFEEAVQSVSGDDWAMFYAIEVHPEYRDETWRLVQLAGARLPPDRQRSREYALGNWAQACGRTDPSA